MAHSLWRSEITSASAKYSTHTLKIKINSEIYFYKKFIELISNKIVKHHIRKNHNFHFMKQLLSIYLTRYHFTFIYSGIYRTTYPLLYQEKNICFHRLRRELTEECKYEVEWIKSTSCHCNLSICAHNSLIQYKNLWVTFFYVEKIFNANNDLLCWISHSMTLQLERKFFI